MPKVTVSAHDVLYNGAGTPAYARVFASQTFENDSDETVIAGGIDSRQYVKQVAVTYSAGVATIASFATTNRLDSTVITASRQTLATYTLTLNDAKGKRLAIVYSGIAIPDTATTTTWTTLYEYSTALPQPFRHQYYDRDQVDALLDDLDLAPDASDVIIGKSRLSYLQSTLLDPVAVGENDPKWRAISDSVYLETYGQTQAGVTAAITAIGSTVTELVVSEAVTISSNSTFPSTCRIKLTGRGAFSVNTGITLTINALDPPPPNRQVFSGLGTVALGKNATGGTLHLEWWTGISDGTSDYSAAMTEVVASMTTGTGTVCKVGPGIWKFDGVTVPDGCFFEGAGRSSNITSGTVFKPYSTSAIDLFTFASGAQYSGLRNCTVTTDGTVSTSSRAVVLTTNATTSFGVQFKNVYMHATLASTAAVFEINDGGPNYEAVGLRMDDVLITVPTNGIGFKSESINTSLLANNLIFLTATGGTDFYISALGWAEINGLDARGPRSAVGTFVDRAYPGSETVDATIANGGTSLTLAGGTFTNNDIGQKIISAGQTFYITGLTSSTVATVTPAASPAITAQNAVIYRYTPDTTTIAGKVFHIVGDHNTFEVNGFADEGFQYFLVNDASTNVSPMTFNAMTIQSLIDIKAACVLAFNGCALRSQLFTDDSGITGTLFFNQCSWDKTSIFNTGTAVELTTATPWGVHDGASKIYTDTSFHEGIQQQHFETRVNFIDRGDGATTPIAGFGSSSNIDQPALRVGRWNDYTKDFDHYYDINRDAAVDGYLDFTGSQAFPNRGYRFNANVCAVTFRGTELTPTQIAANQNDYVPSDSSLFIRLSSDASRNITGMAFTDTQKAGEMHILYNVGSFNITLVNQSGLSAAAYRFQTDTNADVVLAPYQAAFCIYDSTTSRWRVSKWNITGLTSNGTTITGALPVSLTDTLLVAGAATFSSTAEFQDSVDCNDVDIGGGLTMSGGCDISFVGTTGQSKILLTDNLADSLSISESSNAYLTFTTTNSGEKVKAIKALEGTLGITSISPTAGIGYGTGSGNAVAQGSGSGKATTVVSNTISTAITLDNASLNAATSVSFTFTNSAILGVTDQLVVTRQSAGTAGAYTYEGVATGAGSGTITIRNVTGGALGEAVVIRVNIFRSASS